MERKQFTFYQSFREALALIEDPVERMTAYDTIIAYALDGTMPQMETLPKIVQMAFMLIRPTLDSAKQKAINGSKKSKQEANEKQNANEGEKEVEVEKEVEKEVEIEKETDKEKDKEKDKETQTKKECKSKRATEKAFEWFWTVYPKKIGKEEAYREFVSVTEPINTLIQALQRQKQSVQWQKEDGKYIPLPATWLRNKRWTDELPTAYDMGELEIQAIKKIMNGTRFVS